MSLEYREKPVKREHTMVLTDRRQMVLEGVQHVDSFDDDTIALATDMGALIIRGHNLRINQLDLEAGHFSAEGDFDSMAYSHKKTSKNAQTTWKRIWR